MIRSFILLTFFISFLSCIKENNDCPISQPITQEKCRVDSSFYEFNQGYYTEKTIWYYDQNNLEEKAEIFQNGGLWKIYSDFTHDSRGNITSFRAHSDLSCSYNASDKLTSRTYNKKIETWTYNSDGLEESYMVKYETDGYLERLFTNYVYDQNNKLIQYDVFGLGPKNEDTIKYSTVYISYDGQGSVIIVEDVPDNSVSETYTIKRQWEYNLNGLPSKQKFIDENNSVEIYTEYSYDENQNLTSIKSFSFDSTTPFANIKVYYSCDAPANASIYQTFDLPAKQLTSSMSHNYRPYVINRIFE